MQLVASLCLTILTSSCYLAIVRYNPIMAGHSESKVLLWFVSSSNYEKHFSVVEGCKKVIEFICQSTKKQIE